MVDTRCFWSPKPFIAARCRRNYGSGSRRSACSWCWRSWWSRSATMSSGSSVNDALTSYASGRMTAEQLVSVVAGAYYREGGRGKREGLKPVIDVIERAHPGIVELSSASDKPGFSVRLAERPFPKRFENDLRQAVASVVTLPPSPVPLPGLFPRIVRAIRQDFSA